MCVTSVSRDVNVTAMLSVSSWQPILLSLLIRFSSLMMPGPTQESRTRPQFSIAMWTSLGGLFLREPHGCRADKSLYHPVSER